MKAGSRHAVRCPHGRVMTYPLLVECAFVVLVDWFGGALVAMLYSSFLLPSRMWFLFYLLLLYPGTELCHRERWRSMGVACLLMLMRQRDDEQKSVVT